MSCEINEHECALHLLGASESLSSLTANLYSQMRIVLRTPHESKTSRNGKLTQLINKYCVVGGTALLLV